jgi:hypothetical protein
MTFKLRITSSQEGLRRGGVTHHGTQTHPVAGFTAAQILQLLDEPKLQVDLAQDHESGATVIVPWPTERADLEKAVDELVAMAGKAAKRTDRPTTTPEPEADSVLARLTDLEALVQQLHSDVADRDARITELEKQVTEPTSAKAGKARNNPPQS